MLKLNFGRAKRGKIAISGKFCTRVLKAQNFRVLKGVILPERLVCMGISGQKKHSWGVLVLEEKQ